MEPDKAKIMDILLEWNLWEKDLPTGIERPQDLKKLYELIKTEFIINIQGPRRSGKSTIMLQFAKYLIKNGIEPRNLLFINFEDYRFSSLTLETLENIYNLYIERIHTKGKPIIFLDEIHKVPAWERFARTLNDKKEALIIASGSSSKLISAEFSTLLTGRHLSLEVFPLDFREFLLFKGLEFKDTLEMLANKIKIIKLLREYNEYGGFPEVVLKEPKIEILRSYYEDILIKDIVERHSIREIGKLKSLASFYLTNITRPITFSSISKFLNIPLRTVERFSDFLEEVYLLFFIKKYHPSLKEQENAARKVYGIDTGLSNAIGFKLSQNYGKGMENIVFLKLKQLQSKDHNKNIFYWRDQYSDKEVDFLVKEGEGITNAIQVCYDFDNSETKKREISALEKCMSAFQLKEALILTWDFEGEEKVKEKIITVIPLWKWLLETE